MNNNIVNQNKWREVILNNIMIYPKEIVARFIGRNYKNTDNSNKNALDIGFGSGRNSRVLLDYGFNTYGIDYVEECRNTALNLLGGYSNLKELITDNFAEYNWNIKFDVVLMVGVIFLTKEEEVKKNLIKLYNIMKEDGKCLITFRNKSSSLYGNGKQVAENTFILDKAPYNNCLYTFYSQDESIALIENAGFKIDTIEREDYYKSVSNEKELHSWDVYGISKK